MAIQVRPEYEYFIQPPSPTHLHEAFRRLLLQTTVEMNTGHAVWYDGEGSLVCIINGSTNLKLIRSNDMTADILMKSLANVKHERFCLMLGMETVE